MSDGLDFGDVSDPYLDDEDGGFTFSLAFEDDED
jgi:hypothetical protein